MALLQRHIDLDLEIQGLRNDIKRMERETTRMMVRISVKEEEKKEIQRKINVTP